MEVVHSLEYGVHPEDGDFIYSHFSQPLQWSEWLNWSKALEKSDEIESN